MPCGAQATTTMHGSLSTTNKRATNELWHYLQNNKYHALLKTFFLCYRFLLLMNDKGVKVSRKLFSLLFFLTAPIVMHGSRGPGKGKSDL